MHCIISLLRIQNKLKEKDNETNNEINFIVSKNKVFAAALTLMAQGLVNGREQDLTYLSQSDKTKDSWLPLAWAVVAGDMIDEEE